MHFLAKLELQFVWDLVVNLSEEIEKCKSVTSELRKLKSLDTKKKQTLPLGKKKKQNQNPAPVTYFVKYFGLLRLRHTCSCPC